MKVADIFEARLLNRDAVRDAVHIMHDDKEDVSGRITQAEAEELIPKFIDYFGNPTWSEEDNVGMGIWQYQWEQWITNNDGKQHRWFIKIGWYQPSGRGIFNVTRHRKHTDVKEAKHHQQEDVLVCPKCRGSGKGKKQKACWTCDGKKFVPKRQVPFGGIHDDWRKEFIS